MSNPGHFMYSETAREPLEQISFCDILNHPGFSKNGESGYITKHNYCKKNSSLPTKELKSQLYTVSLKIALTIYCQICMFKRNCSLCNFKVIISNDWYFLTQCFYSFAIFGLDRNHKNQPIVPSVCIAKI
jgi:hypothetical protein